MEDGDAAPSPSGITPASGGARSLQPIVLFFAINGVGLGHLTRALSIARHVPGMTPVFVTTCKRAHVLDAFEIPYHYVPAFEELTRFGAAENFSKWNDMLHAFMRTIYDWYRPAALVTDGMLPFRGLMLTWNEYPSVARIGIRRAYKTDGQREVRILERDRQYDQLLVPHTAGEVEVPLPDGVPAEWVGPLVVLERDEAFDRDEARRRLGVPVDGPIVLLQLGAGVLGRGKEQERALIEQLAGRGAHVVVTSYDPGAEGTSENVTVVHRYPMVRYSQAFDLAVAAAGYNTFTELVHHGVPTVFVPNPETMADDQLGRARAAADVGAALVAPYSDDDVLSKIVMDLLDDDEQRAAITRNAIAYLPSSGGRAAGAVVGAVGRRAIEGTLDRPIDVTPGPVPADDVKKEAPAPSTLRRVREIVGDRSLPVSGRGAHVAGLMLARMKAYTRAEGVLSWAERRTPGALGPLASLADLALKRGRYDEAERYARAALEQQPAEPAHHRRLVQALARQGKREEAIALAEAYLARANDPMLGRIRRGLVVGRHRQAARDALDEGRLDEAMAEVERALRTDPRDGGSHLVRARVLRHQGHLTEALRSIERARAIGRDSGTFEHKIQGLLRVIDEEWLPEIPGTPRTFEPVAGRVLHLLDRSLPQWQSGYTVRSYYTFEALRDAGFDPVAVTRLGYPEIDGGEAGSNPEEVDGISYHRLTAPGTNYKGLPEDQYVTMYAEKAAEAVERIKPSLLHPATSHLNGLVAMALKHRYGLPVIYEVRGFREDSWALDRDAAATTELFQGRLRTEYRLMREADRVVTIAEVMKDEMVERGIDAAKIAVIPNAVDVERFTPRPANPELISSLGLGDRVVLGYITTLVGFEGVDLLLRAIRQLLDEGMPVAGLIVGGGPELEPLRALAAELGIAEHVHLVGRVPHDDILDYYAAIDVFVVPRRNLRVTRLVTPLKPFEAMAMQRAMLVSDLDALCEIVAPGERGLSFRADDAGDLAAQARVLVGNEDLRRRFGEAARTWVARERTWKRNGERYRELYDELLGTRAAR